MNVNQGCYGDRQVLRYSFVCDSKPHSQSFLTTLVYIILRIYPFFKILGAIRLYCDARKIKKGYFCLCNILLNPTTFIQTIII
jgi:hypothetical protein